MCHKNKLKFENYNCASNSTWKLNNPARKSKLDVYSLGKNYEEFIKNNKLILKSQQRLRYQNLNVFILSRLF